MNVVLPRSPISPSALATLRSPCAAFASLQEAHIDDEGLSQSASKRRRYAGPTVACGGTPRVISPLASPLASRSINVQPRTPTSPDDSAAIADIPILGLVGATFLGPVPAAASAPSAVASSVPATYGSGSPSGLQLTCSHLTPHSYPHLRPPPIATVSSMDAYDLIGSEAGSQPSLPPVTPRGMHFAAAPTPTPGSGNGWFGRNGGGANANSSSLRFGGGPASGLRPRHAPMSLVAPNLYVGDESAAASLATLRACGIRHVLNCTDQPTPLEEDGYSGDGGEVPTFLRLGLLDSTADLPRMHEVLRVGVDFIDAAIASGGSVLVHCHRGISRSATLAMGYLIQTQQKPAEAIFEAIRKKRRVIDPNLAYWCALKEWEASVLLAPVRPKSVTNSCAASSTHSSKHPSARASPRHSMSYVNAMSPYALGAGGLSAGASGLSSPLALAKAAGTATNAAAATTTAATTDAQPAVTVRPAAISPLHSVLTSPRVSPRLGSNGLGSRSPAGSASLGSRSPAHSHSSGVSARFGGSACGSPIK